jgi:uncharacterized repeat protein (TIGR01451 family)
LKNIISFSLGALLILTIVTPAWAAVRCETQYGGSQVCVETGQLQLDKKIWDPQKETFIDNLGITSYKFSPNEEITFRIIVKNIGEEAIEKVNFQDTLPSSLVLSDGELEKEFDHLDPGGEKEIIIKARVALAEQLPQNQQVICQLNSAKAWSELESDEDTSQFCVQKKEPVVVLPPTGPKETIITSLLALLILGITGQVIIKLLKQKSN